MSLGIRMAAVLALGLSVAACGGGRVEELAFNDTPPDQLYNEALVLMNEGDVRTAQIKFEEVDRLHPHTEFGRKSQMMLAFTSYSRGKYPEAINAAKRFLALHPNHEDAAYAQYIIGNSYYKQIPDVTRDQRETEQALAAFRILIEKYPDSEYTPDARNKVLAAEDQLAGKQMEVGRYYLERNDNLAAINRFRNVVENYQQTRHVEEALFRLTESYYALGLTQEAQTAAAVLGHNFPDSKWYRDSYALLEKGGYSPSEAKASWISRAFSSINVL
ncbi:outer membrane protein assembly factor BamD [Acuticoccus sp. MNP-M23]|uniref:outer membrane protein assembly factor BamD n=1 Tax=Acuticoccus sp. MNP-M23 TaxID=3072793 RepID=UPI0028169A6F|nr:outer membrane protein assembly factor BamD [Acuticoccus sp. MNP-M23]WMS40859.1 outer membrane protein assembly factor BamD [Acuticoccus sp. MNP-M23]